MSGVLLETEQRRLVAPQAVFSGRCRHPCYGNCGSVMVVPSEEKGAGNRLEEGDCWECVRCGTIHEYYLAYAGGSRWATIRVLRGPHRRESGEPTIGEFLLP